MAKRQHSDKKALTEDPGVAKLRSLIFARKAYDVVKFAVDIDLFSRMSRAVSTEALALEMDIKPGLLSYLLAFLADTGYLRRVGAKGHGSYINMPVSDKYLNRKSPAFIGTDIFNDADTYDILKDRTAGDITYESITKKFWNARFVSTIGSKSMLGLVQATADVVELAGRKRLLDIGGGHGLYSIFFIKKNPGLYAWVLDLPAVTSAARESIEKFEAGDRVSIIEADFNDFEPQFSFDVAFASNFLGTSDDLGTMMLKARALLEDGGWLILRNYASDVVEDARSSLVALDRYARRESKGFASRDITLAMENSGFSDINEIYRGDGVVIIKGVKKDR